MIAPSCRYILKSRSIDKKGLDKLNFIEQQSDIDSITLLPDFSNDNWILSGIQFNSQKELYLLGAGTDIGCGYRVLICKNTSRSLLTKIETEFKNFSQSITDSKPGYSITIDDIHKLFDNANEWMTEKQLFNESDESKEYEKPHCFNSSSLLNFNNIIKSIGRIACGNHFMEFRKITDVYDEKILETLNISSDDFLIIIHSGVGKLIENDFLQYVAKFYVYNELEDSLKNLNGYKLRAPLNSDLSQMFINDVYRSKVLSFINRQILTYLLREWINSDIILLFDVVHDDILINSKEIKYFKGCQNFIPFSDNFSLALIPGTINDHTYIVNKHPFSPINFINHGVGEGVEGKAINKIKVLSNLKNKINRKYYDIEEIIKYLNSQKIAYPLMKLRPWISIKNGGDW